MDIEAIREYLHRCGGLAQRSELPFTDYWLARAVQERAVVRSAPGRYCLPTVAEARREAHRLNGALCHLSAAVDHGWPVAQPPLRPQVMIPRGRKVRSAPTRIDLGWGTLTSGELRWRRTGPLRTVVDCARRLPFGEALAVADSALRAGDVHAEELARAAQSCRGPGTGAVRAVAASASGLAANPFESGARAVCLAVPGLTVRPQIRICDEAGFAARVDLADLELGFVIECDGFDAHGSRRAFDGDRDRYTRLAMLDWLVFLYTWPDVFRTPDQTLSRLTEWVAAAQNRWPQGRPGVWRATIASVGDAQYAA